LCECVYFYHNECLFALITHWGPALLLFWLSTHRRNLTSADDKQFVEGEKNPLIRKDNTRTRTKNTLQSTCCASLASPPLPLLSGRRSSFASGSGSLTSSSSVDVCAGGREQSRAIRLAHIHPYVGPRHRVKIVKARPSRDCELVIRTRSASISEEEASSIEEEGGKQTSESSLSRQISFYRHPARKEDLRAGWR